MIACIVGYVHGTCHMAHGTRVTDTLTLRQTGARSVSMRAMVGVRVAARFVFSEALYCQQVIQNLFL